MLPRRREKPRSHIERAPKREWPRHRAFVEKHECCVGWRSCCVACSGDVVAAHVRTETLGGEGLKPADWWTISLCNAHHEEQHALGEPAFERLYGIDMKKLAAEFAAKSPDVKMKAAMKEAAQAVLLRYVAQGGPTNE